MQRILFTTLLILSLSITGISMALEAPSPAQIVELDSTNPARTKYKSLHKKLDRLRGYFEAGKGKQMLTTIKTLNRDLEAVKAKDPSLDLSAETAEIAAYAEIAEEVAANAEAQKNADKDYKNLDREIKKLERLVEQGKRSKPKPDQFDLALEKVDEQMNNLLDGNPDLDMTSRQDHIDQLVEEFEPLIAVFEHGRAFKDIDFHLGKLSAQLEKVEGSAERGLFVIPDDKIRAGQSFWPTLVDEYRDNLIAAFEDAQAKHADINLTSRARQLADIDAHIADLKARHTQKGLDQYFTYGLDQLAKRSKDLVESFNSGFTYDSDDVSHDVELIEELSGKLADGQKSYPEANFSQHENRYATLVKEFNQGVALHSARLGSEDYYKRTAAVLKPLGGYEELDLLYDQKQILNSGIEDLDVAALRQRLVDDESKPNIEWYDNVKRHLAQIESFMVETDYINGVKEFIKLTNDDELELPDRQNFADIAGRLAVVGQNFFPKDNRYTQLVNETQKRTDTLQEELQQRYAEASTGDFHIAHMDTIVFHRAPLEIGSENTSLVSDRFNAAEPIYGTAYLSVPLRDVSLITNKPEYIELDFQIGTWGCQEYSRGYVSNVTRDSLGNTYLQFTVMPVANEYEYTRYNDAHINFADCQQENSTLGDQEVLVELGLKDPGTKKKIALAGKFTLSFDAESPAKLETIVNQLYEKRVDVARLPKAKLSNPQYESLLMEAAKSVDGEPVRAVLSSDTWVIQKNWLGVPLRQGLVGTVAVKTAENKCFYYSAALTAVYIGGSYGSPVPDRITDRGEEIRCENVDK